MRKSSETQLSQPAYPAAPSAAAQHAVDARTASVTKMAAPVATRAAKPASDFSHHCNVPESMRASAPDSPRILDARAAGNNVYRPAFPFDTLGHEDTIPSNKNTKIL